MLKHLIKIGALFLMLFLAACGGGSVSDTAVPQQPEQAEETAPENIEVAPVDEAIEAEAMPVAARPQFIEFYADW